MIEFLMSPPKSPLIAYKDIPSTFTLKFQNINKILTKLLLIPKDIHTVDGQQK